MTSRIDESKMFQSLRKEEKKFLLTPVLFSKGQPNVHLFSSVIIMYILARFNIKTEINLAVITATPVHAISPVVEWSIYS